MSAPAVIALRLFSGPHLGAEIMLPAGSFALGSDDSCDLILQDSTVAARHARLDVQVAGEDVSVTITPLDKAVQVQGEDIPAGGIPLAPEIPCRLGLSSFAWALPGALPDAWARVIVSVQQAARSIASGESGKMDSPGTAPATELSSDPAEGAAEGEEAVIELSDVVDSTANTVLADSPRKPASVRHYLIMGAGLLCLCGLVFSYAGRPASPERRAELVQVQLQENGFPTLRALPMGQGVSVLGVVRHDGERVALLKMAQNMHFPVYLDVVVQGDKVNAIRTAFNSRGFFPDVVEENGSIRVSGYAKDGLVEEGAFSAVRGDIPELREDAAWAQVERTIRHASDVEPVLKRELTTRDLGSVGVRFLSGQVELAGVFDADQHLRLSQALEAVRLELGVPVLFTVVPSFAQADARRALGGLPGSAGTPAFGGAARSGGTGNGTTDPLDSVQVTGVTLSPMRFIALSNGQRIFEGGLLPGGYTLEKIEVNSLTLRKDGQTVAYPLRGTHE